MHHAFGNNDSLSRRKLESAAFQINEQLAIHDIKKLVILIVLMPVILSLYDPEPDHGVIDLAERLFVPSKLARVPQHPFINHLYWFVHNVPPLPLLHTGTSSH